MTNINLRKPFESKSLDEAIEAYRCISKDFQEFENNNQDTKFKYSNYNFLRCERSEQEDFYNNQLQLIECLVMDKIYNHTGIIQNWYDIYKLLFDKEYALCEKNNRKVVFPSTSSQRPVGDKAYNVWNGLQIIDLDIKDKDIADGLKPLLFNSLKKFNWFLGLCTSASGKSLHVWTKINPITVDLKDRKVEYICNFRQKYSYVYIILLQYSEKFGYSKEQILQFMDLAMMKPQQGIFISSDRGALLNMNFQDLRLDVNFESAIDNGVVTIDWINHPDLKEIFARLTWFNDETYNKLTNTNFEDLSDLDKRDNSKNIRKHYKHAQRWQIANTLTNLYGADKALEIMLDICKETPKKELVGDIRTASLHNKPISLWAVNELNKYHGFKIKLKSDVIKSEFEKGLDRVKQNLEENSLLDPTRELNSNTTQTTFFLKSNEYLSTIEDKILSNLSKLTLLEAGAGYGKTEMVKAFDDRTLLVLPFRSTIQSKVDNDDRWITYYGNLKPSIDDIMGDRNLCMTIDKFANLNICLLNLSSIKYIVFDESHLLFTSSYRDVMSPAIQHLANCKAKVVLMSGTPTAEKLFFPEIKHIKVYKEDLRDKTFTYYLCPTPLEQKYEMCLHIANDVLHGRKVLLPTDRGNVFFDQICGLVQKIIEEKEENLSYEEKIFKGNRELKCFYYKKSNIGEEVMDSINNDATILDYDIIFCSTYLSVGVDIKDKYDFNVYFFETMIPQNIEQYANRLRENNLHIHMFLPLEDNSGEPIEYWKTQPMSFDITNEELIKIRDLLATCNDMLERNSEENKYSPLINSIISANKFIKYDENECKYFLDNTTYKLFNFENNYKVFASQLDIITKTMKYYGYEIGEYDEDKYGKIERVDGDRREKLEKLMIDLKYGRLEYRTHETMEFLEHITDENIDLYREITKGDYKIFKDKDFAEERTKNNLYTRDIEVLEKNIPIVLSLYRYYDIDNIKSIYKFCQDPKTYRINFSKLERVRKLVNIEFSRRKRRLDFPVLKFMYDARQFAKENPEPTENELELWKQNYACRFANAIPNLIVDDNAYLEEIIDLVDNLFKVIIIQERPKGGVVKIKPFELLWQTREQLKDLYGDLNTQNFLISTLMDNMKDEDEEEQKLNEEDEKLEELQKLPKIKLEEAQNEINDLNVLGFDYYDYSSKDGSNTRFMVKQKNTNPLKDDIFGQLEEESEDDSNKEINQQGELFDNIKTDIV